MKTKKTMKGRGESKPLSKLEVLDKYPKVAEALQQFVAERQTGSGRMMGGGWWDDFVNWLKENKVISTVSKIGSVIAGAVGALPVAAALSAVSAGSSTLGYGYVNNLSKVGVRRPKPMMNGKGVVTDFVKKHKLVSRGLSAVASVVPHGRDALNEHGAKNTLYKLANSARMAGYGPVYSQNGMLVAQPKQSGGCGCGKMMGGATTQYNTVSTEFSEVKFR